MSFEYIRRTYGVPAERGHRVEYAGGDEVRRGTIVDENGAHIFIHFDGDETDTGPFHPTWKLAYIGRPVKSPVAPDDWEIPF